MIAPVLVYVFFAFLVAYFGRNRKFGFWVYFLLSFIFTPLISFIIVLASAKRTPLAAATPVVETSAPAA
jgi:hypothetical protein